MTDQRQPRDPFEELARPIEPQEPRASFRRHLRNQLASTLGVDDEIGTISFPERTTMTTTDPTTTSTTTAPSSGLEVTPYLAVAGAVEALDWYIGAFGAVEQFRVVGDDGRLGHAEFAIGAARFMLSDEYPEIDVLAPASLGGSGVGLHLSVTDVDTTYDRAVAAGATALAPPADQPHGARHGTLRDPFGHRWMLSQPIERVSLDEYADRSQGSGFTVKGASPSPAAVPSPRGDGIWSVVAYRDALAGIRFLVEVFGFEEQLVVVGDDGVSVTHSELRWPEGGIVQVADDDAANPFVPAPGAQSLYVVTADPWAVWERCQAAGLEVLRAPASPHYDPDGMGFSVRDHERNVFSFGTYAGPVDDA